MAGSRVHFGATRWMSVIRGCRKQVSSALPLATDTFLRLSGPVSHIAQGLRSHQPRCMSESHLELPAEMRNVVEALAQCDLGDCQMVKARVAQLRSGAQQAFFPHPGAERRAGRREQFMQIALRHVQRPRYVVGVDVGIVEMTAQIGLGTRKQQLGAAAPSRLLLGGFFLAGLKCKGNEIKRHLDSMQSVRAAELGPFAGEKLQMADGEAGHARVDLRRHRKIAAGIRQAAFQHAAGNGDQHAVGGSGHRRAVRGQLVEQE